MANGLALEGPSVGLYVPLLEFNRFGQRISSVCGGFLAMRFVGRHLLVALRYGPLDPVLDLRSVLPYPLFPFLSF